MTSRRGVSRSTMCELGYILISFQMSGFARQQPFLKRAFHDF